MRLARILVPLAAVVTLTLTWSTPASAATINVSPSTVAVGGQVTVSGDVLANGQPGCQVPGDVTLISRAFQGLGEFAGVGAITAQADSSGNFSVTATLPATTGPGTYKITGRCGGGNLGVSASLTVVGQDVCRVPVPGGRTGCARQRPGARATATLDPRRSRRHRLRDLAAAGCSGGDPDPRNTEADRVVALLGRAARQGKEIDPKQR